MDAATGGPLDGPEHLRQSIRDVLTTRIGTRVMRREYGSRVPDLVDAPMNEGLRVRIAAAGIEALARWEPRYRVRRLAVRGGGDDGRLVVDLDGEYLPDGSPLAIGGVTL